MTPFWFETATFRLTRNVFGQWKLSHKVTRTYEFLSDAQAAAFIKGL